MTEYMFTPFSDTTPTMERIEQNDNNIVFSSLREFYKPVYSKGFAIKYVVEGSERYVLNNQQYIINAGNYLLCKSDNEGHVEIESRKNVKGICINIAPELVQQAAASLQRPDNFFPDAELAKYLHSPCFIENQYLASTTALGNALLEIEMSVKQNSFLPGDLSAEFFYTLSEKLVADQLPVFKQLQSLPGIKAATKKELHKRISRGKAYIDLAYNTPLTIEMVSKEACMSEYHFFRLFKTMLGVSPHLYILLKRLETGKKLLETDQYPVSEAAIECGFTDIYSFSRAFKKQFGITPSSLLYK